MSSQHDASQLIRQGVSAHKSGDTSTALRLFQQAVRRDPQRQSGWIWLATLLDNTAQKQECLERVVALDPTTEAAKRAQTELTRIADTAIELPVLPSTSPAPDPVSPAVPDPPSQPDQEAVQSFSLPSSPNNYQYSPQTPSYPVSDKDPNTALIIEIIAGLFGFLGIGCLYAGKTFDGIIRLIGWWIFAPLLIFIGIVLAGPTGGVTFCLLPLLLLGPILSGLNLKKQMTTQPAHSSAAPDQTVLSSSKINDAAWVSFTLGIYTLFFWGFQIIAAGTGLLQAIEHAPLFQIIYLIAGLLALFSPLGATIVGRRALKKIHQAGGTFTTNKVLMIGLLLGYGEILLFFLGLCFIILGMGFMITSLTPKVDDVFVQR